MIRKKSRTLSWLYSNADGSIWWENESAGEWKAQKHWSVIYKSQCDWSLGGREICYWKRRVPCSLIDGDEENDRMMLL